MGSAWGSPNDIDSVFLASWSFGLEVNVCMWTRYA